MGKQKHEIGSTTVAEAESPWGPTPSWTEEPDSQPDPWEATGDGRLSVSDILDPEFSRRVTGREIFRHWHGYGDAVSRSDRDVRAGYRLLDDDQRREVIDLATEAGGGLRTRRYARKFLSAVEAASQTDGPGLKVLFNQDGSVSGLRIRGSSARAERRAAKYYGKLQERASRATERRENEMPEAKKPGFKVVINPDGSFGGMRWESTKKAER